MPGAVDPIYVNARRTLLDALDALVDHIDALVLVGAQAVYHYTDESDIPGAEFTTDADFSIEPDALSSDPLLGEAMIHGGFRQQNQPGSWISPSGVLVDLMVPKMLAGGGRRGARLGRHGNLVARHADGLEASLIDKERLVIESFDINDSRSRLIWIVGPAALIVAKTIKIAERVDLGRRSSDKDALDVFRLLQAVPTNEMSGRFELLKSNPLSSEVAERTLRLVRELFGDSSLPGVEMARRAAAGLSVEDARIVGDSLVALVADLTDAVV